MTPHCYLVPLQLRTQHTLKRPLIIISSGMMGLSGAGNETELAFNVANGYSQMPDIWMIHEPISWRKRGSSCIMKLDMLKEELMARAWHPDRMMEWCWDDEERGEFGTLFSPISRQPPYRIWYDEVLVTDVSDKERGQTSKGTMIVNLDEGRGIRLVSSTGRGFVAVCGRKGRCVIFDKDKPYWMVQHPDSSALPERSAPS